MKSLIPIIVLAALLPVLCSDAGAQDRARVLRSREMDVQFHRARKAWTTGNSMLEAKTRIDRVLDQLPDDIPALKLRSSVLMNMQDPEAAMADARRATRLDPGDGEAQLLLCESALAANQTVTALNALGQASNLLLEDVERYVRLSRCAVGLDRMTEARAIARLAVVADRNDPRGHIQLARVFVQSGDASSARAVLQTVFDMDLLRKETVQADTLLAPLLATLDIR